MGGRQCGVPGLRLAFSWPSPEWLMDLSLTSHSQPGLPAESWLGKGLS